MASTDLRNVIPEEKMKTGVLIGPESRSIILLVVILAAAKIATFLPLFLFSDIHHADFLQELGTKWDSDFYDKIAELGYKGASNPGTNDAYAFSPVLPSMIAALRPFAGSYWSAGLLVVNTFSFLFPIVIFKLSDFRTALITELFPVYLVFSTLNYADIITLFFLALSLFFLLRRGRQFLTGVSLAFAVLTSYAVILTVPIFAAKLIFDKRQTTFRRDVTVQKVKELGRFVLPVAAIAISIAAFFLVETASLWTFFNVEKNAGWDVTIVTPVEQLQFLLHGWFTGFHWTVMGTYLPPIYWVIRNIAFEAFYVAGVVLLLMKRNRVPDRWFLAGLALSIMTPLFFLNGVAAASIPRLLLPAFPVFFGYSAGLLRGNRSLALYCVLCLVIAPLVALIQLDALFS